MSSSTLRFFARSERRDSDRRSRRSAFDFRASMQFRPAPVPLQGGRDALSNDCSLISLGFLPESGYVARSLVSQVVPPRTLQLISVSTSMSSSILVPPGRSTPESRDDRINRLHRLQSQARQSIDQAILKVRNASLSSSSRATICSTCSADGQLSTFGPSI